MKKRLQHELGYETVYVSFGGMDPEYVPFTKEGHCNHLPNGRCVHYECGKIDQLFKGCELDEFLT